MVCGGCVRAVVEFPYSDVIGGPPMGGHVSHWACNDCGLMYERCPKRKQAQCSHGTIGCRGVGDKHACEVEK